MLEKVMKNKVSSGIEELRAHPVRLNWQIKAVLPIAFVLVNGLLLFTLATAAPSGIGSSRSLLWKAAASSDSFNPSRPESRTSSPMVRSPSVNGTGTVIGWYNW